MIYADTSVVVSSYLNEPRTAESIGLLSLSEEPLLISRLLHLEVVNAINLQIFWKKYDKTQARALISRFDLEIQQGCYVMKDGADAQVWEKAEELSNHYASVLGNRSLDVWHVAFAICHGVDLFLTFDGKQKALADAVGLKTNPL